MNWVSYQDLLDDVPRFAAGLPRDLAGIVGIPRSGVMAGSLLALHMGLPLAEAGTFAETGRFFDSGGRIGSAPNEGKILLVDDSSRGNSIRSWVRLLTDMNTRMNYRLLTGCFYGTEEAVKLLDFVHRVVRPWRVFQWNLFGHRGLRRMACDIDGVMCEDPECSEADAAGYEQHLVDARPLHLPRKRLGLVVTSRFERWRSQTEEWLWRHGVVYDELVMHPNLPAGRRNHARHKAGIYARSNCRLMIESDRRQAARIAKATSRPVLCVANWKLYRGNA